MAPTLSVLCPTGHPGPLVVNALAPLRNVADEIIVAADSRASENDLAHYATVADTLLRFEFSGANRHWPWLAAQATSDWLLIIDGDELVSPVLIAAIPELIADRRISQYLMPIHWPWWAAEPGGPVQRLTSEPWGSDRRLRLLRNDGRLAFSAQKHALAVAAPPVAYRDDLPVYHLDLLLRDRKARERKVHKYDIEFFGLLTPEGVPFNRAFYLPEDDANAQLADDIPADDLALIHGAAATTPTMDSRLAATTLPLADRATILRSAPEAATREPGQRGTLSIRSLPSFTAQYPNNVVWVELTHQGTVTWDGAFGAGDKITIAAGWRPVAGGQIQEVSRTELPHAVEPGEAVLVPIGVPSAPLEGDAELVIGLSDGVRAFDSQISRRVTILPSVRQRLDAAIRTHGELLPLEAVAQIRNTVNRRDGLLPAGTEAIAAAQSAPPPADPMLADLASALTLGEWALDGPTIDRLAQRIGELRPKTVVEFGSGTSTVLIAALLAKQGAGARLISFEQDPAWVQTTRERLVDVGLDQVVELLHLPLGDLDPDLPKGYVLTKEAASALRRSAPSLVLVDGPTLDSKASRLGTLHLVGPFVAPDTLVLLDDAFRDAELSIAAAWDSYPNITLMGYLPTAKGLLELKLDPLAGTPAQSAKRFLGRSIRRAVPGPPSNG